MAETAKRTGMNVGITDKGQAQRGVTAEYALLEAAAKNLS
jgi:hypothetical protein